MLQVVYCPDPQSKKDYFLERNREPSCLWVVSHIEAKQWMLSQELAQKNAISTQFVLRASEYWQWLFHANLPEYRMISESLIYALIEDWFQKGDLASRYQNIEVFYNLLVQCSPLSYSAQKEIFLEWIEAEEERRQRLLDWVLAVQKFQQDLLQKKWIGRPWILGPLLDLPEVYYGDHEKYFFDLGLDLKNDEVEMILKLAQHKDVTVLIPHSPWVTDYEFQMSVYKRIIESAKETEHLNSKNDSQMKISFAEENSVLNETKLAVRHLRALLGQGVPPEKIAIVSGNLEEYWILMNSQLAHEGIPVNKATVIRAIALPTVQSWISRLQVLKEEFSQANLESLLFSQEEEASLSYRDFKKNFSNIYDFKFVREHFALGPAISSHLELSLSEFIEILYQKWQNEDSEIIDELADRMMKEIALTDRMSFAVWLKYLELLLSRYEIPHWRGRNEGVQFFNFNSADWSDCEHFIVLGCTQSALCDYQNTPFRIEDIFAIERDLGFYLQRKENLKAEFDLLWLMEMNLKKVVLCHSLTDFSGEPQMVANLWLKLKSQKSGAEIEQSTSRWDSLMTAALPEKYQSLKLAPHEQNCLEAKLKWEEDGSIQDKMSPLLQPRLSVSALQSLEQCAFKFYAERALDLDERRELDLEVDPLYSGQLLHKILEIIIYKSEIEKSTSFEGIGSQLSQIYDQALEQVKIQSPLEEFWRYEKNRILTYVHNFLQLEAEYRKSLPHLQTLATEAEIKGYITTQDGSISLSVEKTNEQSLSFKGKIDRVDHDGQGNALVLDYKSSAGSIKSFSSWLENGQFQMPIYAEAVEKGLLRDKKQWTVAGADYVLLKEKKRGLGYTLNNQPHFVAADFKQNLISQEEFQHEKENVFARISELLSTLAEQKFPAKPKDEKYCKTCAWRPLCRAPHLR